MYCKNCGTEVNDNTAFCHACGSPLHEQVSNNYQNNNLQVQQNNSAIDLDKSRSCAVKALVFGILSCVLFWFPVIGIVFSCVAKGNANRSEYYAGGDKMSGPAIAGNILGTVFLVLSIISIVWLLIFAIVGV